MKNRLKAFAKKIRNSKLGKAVVSCCAVVGAVVTSVITAFAEEPVTDIAPEAAASQVFGFMAKQLNFTTILSVLGVVIGAALAMVLGWWAIRKVAFALQKAFTSGKLKI